jgi:nitrate reductase gamma subunit
MEYYINQFIFGVFPYIAGSVFIFGSLIRFERGQYTWRAMSSQMLTNKERWFRWASIAFHVGILLLFFGHLVRPADTHLVVRGPGTCVFDQAVDGHRRRRGVWHLCFFGLTYLLWRRLFNARVRENSAGMDTFIICLIWLQLVTGLCTIWCLHRSPGWLRDDATGRLGPAHRHLPLRRA